MRLASLEDFPAATRCTYLNSASVALMSAGAAEAAIAWQRDIADFGTLNFDEVAEDRVFDDLRAAFGRLVGAKAESIAIGSSATEMLSSLAWAVAPTRGQNIVAVDAVFPSTSYPWMRVARSTGSQMRWVRTQDGVANPADILGAIDDNKCAVLKQHEREPPGHDISRCCNGSLLRFQPGQIRRGLRLRLSFLHSVLRRGGGV